MYVCMYVVLTGSGSFNPLTRMHVRLFYLAKQYLETKQGFVVLGSLLSPAHRQVVYMYVCMYTMSTLTELCIQMHMYACTISIGLRLLMYVCMYVCMVALV